MNHSTEMMLAAALERFDHELDIMERVVGEIRNDVDGLITDMESVKKAVAELKTEGHNE